MKIEYKGKQLGLNQSYSKGIRFMMLNDKLEPLHQPVFCKDYLTDVIWCEHNNKYDEVVYGFKYPKNDYKHIDNKWLNIAIDNTELNIATEGFKSNLQNFLNKAEHILGFSESVCSLEDNCIVIKYSNEWIKYPYLISLFTMFLRVGLSYDGSDFIKYITEKNTNIKLPDSEFLFNAKKKINKIFVDKYLPEVKYTDYNVMESTHNSSGIVSTPNNYFKV